MPGDKRKEVPILRKGNKISEEWTIPVSEAVNNFNKGNTGPPVYRTRLSTGDIYTTTVQIVNSFYGQIDTSVDTDEEEFRDERYYINKKDTLMVDDDGDEAAKAYLNDPIDWPETETGDQQRVIATNLAEWGYNTISRHTIHDLYPSNWVHVFELRVTHIKEAALGAGESSRQDIIETLFVFSMTPTVIFFVAKIPTEAELTAEYNAFITDGGTASVYNNGSQWTDARYILIRQRGYDNAGRDDFEDTDPFTKSRDLAAPVYEDVPYPERVVVGTAPNSQDVLYNATNISELENDTHFLPAGTYVHVFSVKNWDDESPVYFFDKDPGGCVLEAEFDGDPSISDGWNTVNITLDGGATTVDGLIYQGGSNAKLDDDDLIDGQTIYVIPVCGEEDTYLIIDGVGQEWFYGDDP